MTPNNSSNGKAFELDEEDREILRILQVDATLPLEKIATKVGLSKTAVWNRLQRMRQEGVITGNVLIINPQKTGLPETFFVALKTSRHNETWLKTLQKIVLEMPEIMEAHRLGGDIDYLLKVQVSSTRAYDEFYKRFVSKIELFDVTSNLSMEVLKQETALPI